MGPRHTIGAIDWPGPLGDRIGRATVVVFAGEIDEIDGQRRTRQVGQLEVIPIRLAVAMILVRLTLHSATQVVWRDVLNLSYVAAFEIADNFDTREASGPDLSMDGRKRACGRQCDDRDCRQKS